MTKNNDTVKSYLQVEIYSAWKKIAGIRASLISKEEVDLTIPKQSGFGDYTTAIALKGAKILKKPPVEIAQKMTKELNNDFNTFKKRGIEKIEFRVPGFINFYFSPSFFIRELEGVLRKNRVFENKVIGLEQLTKFLNNYSKNIKLDHPSRANTPQDKKIRIMVEYAHPNTHKQFHIGHLRNIILAESLIRLLETLGMKIIRVNYQGDVGMHIAKCLYGIIKIKKENKTSFDTAQGKQDKISLLSQSYVLGNKAYEESDKAKQEIIEINRKIYNKDKEIISLWEKTRKWSLDYFETIYKKVDSHFDRYYFESEVVEKGKELVKIFLEKGVFEKSEGAVIFPGEKQGLHNRVFITKDSFATYEAKDIGLAVLQFKEYNPDLIIHVVAPEQTAYFQVVFQALSQILPQAKGKEMHFIYGWVNLKKGKMSSRKGEVVTGEWLLNKAQEKAREIIKGSSNKNKEKINQEKVSEIVGVGAVKYSMLKFAPRSDISFDFDESVSLEGDSGPYLQYSYARCQSVLRKALIKEKPIEEIDLNIEELNLIRAIYQFEEAVFNAGVNFAPNYLCQYLFDLAQKYNLFYSKCPILTAKEGEKTKNLRLLLTKATANILKQGLYLLGISSPERM